MKEPTLAYRGHVIYMNLNTGEELHEYTEKVYATKGGATRARNWIVREFGLPSKRIRDPNYTGQHYWMAPMIDDPSDTRSNDEKLPMYRNFTEVATEWKEV